MAARSRRCVAVVLGSVLPTDAVYCQDVAGDRNTGPTTSIIVVRCLLMAMVAVCSGGPWRCCEGLDLGEHGQLEMGVLGSALNGFLAVGGFFECWIAEVAAHPLDRMVVPISLKMIAGRLGWSGAGVV
ncbi:hypothetical protein ACLOJK_034338 [Asimina triloba]